MITQYLIYNTESEALAKADAEGTQRGYAYHTTGTGTRYHTYPMPTAENKYALEVSDYLSLTNSEKTAQVTNVSFPDND